MNAGPIGELRRVANEHLSWLVGRYFPNRYIPRDKLLAGDVFGSKGKSFQLCLKGQHKGNWIDWAVSSGKNSRGDVLDLIAIREGVEGIRAVREKMVEWGWMTNENWVNDKKHVPQPPPPAPELVTKPEPKPDFQSWLNSPAQNLWDKGTSVTETPEAVEYFDKYMSNRGFLPKDFEWFQRDSVRYGHMLHLVRSVTTRHFLSYQGRSQFHSKHRKGEDVYGALLFPCLDIETGTPQGLWRVFHTRMGGKIQSLPRAGLGRMKGCVFPVYDWYDFNQSSCILLAEGIETAFAWSLLTENRHCTVLACFNTSNMIEVARRLPAGPDKMPQVDEWWLGFDHKDEKNRREFAKDAKDIMVYVGGDNDEAGGEAASEACRILRERGFQSRTVWPPERFGNDANDALSHLRKSMCWESALW